MSTPPLSFDRAQFEGDPPSADACAFCKRGIEGDYYRVANNLACSTCAANAQGLTPPNEHGAFVRALLYGIVAAILGCAIYALVEINFNLTIGYLAIAVGWAIGYAMKAGAKGHGGRRYQIAAAILTYVAVSMAFIPLAIHQYHEDKRPAVSSSATAGSSAEAKAPDASTSAQTSQKKSANTGGVLIGLVMLFGIGLASPFLVFTSSFFSGAINLFVLYLGVQYAWRFTASPKIEVEGPFASV